MPRVDAITLKVEAGIARADVVVDGVTYRDLILRRRRNRTHVSWPRSTKLAWSTRRRLEPKIARALDQWCDLAGGAAGAEVRPLPK